ncbi:unnamed protein product [Clonostachys byssicola]|uniref:Uncharacterized protein n=1 Tax=Clonostachys byssicola TaxID=160290 RepID=A0A9N9UHQ4_9HYPO|nr:unnamed protein product [Clonostachys byssicola]
MFTSKKFSRNPVDITAPVPLEERRFPLKHHLDGDTTPIAGLPYSFDDIHLMVLLPQYNITRQKENAQTKGGVFANRVGNNAGSEIWAGYAPTDMSEKVLVSRNHNDNMSNALARHQANLFIATRDIPLILVLFGSFFLPKSNPCDPGTLLIRSRSCLTIAARATTLVLPVPLSCLIHDVGCPRQMMVAILVPASTRMTMRI